MVPAVPVVALMFSEPPEVEVKASLEPLVASASLPPVTEPSGEAVTTVPANAASVIGHVQSMSNTAPETGSSASLTLLMRRSPPIRKQAGPALRLLACDCDGAAVVLA